MFCVISKLPFELELFALIQLVRQITAISIPVMMKKFNNPFLFLLLCVLYLANQVPRSRFGNQ